MSSSLDKCYLFHSVSKNKKTYFNFLLLSEMRHSYLRCPTSSRCTMPVYYLWPTPNALLYIYSHMSYSEHATSNSRVSYSECHTPYNPVFCSKCPTPYKCALLRIDTVGSPASYKNLIPDGARRWAQPRIFTGIDFHVLKVTLF